MLPQKILYDKIKKIQLASVFTDRCELGIRVRGYSAMPVNLYKTTKGKIYNAIFSCFFLLLILIISPLKTHAMELDDSSLWIQKEGFFEIVNNSMSLRGETGCAVFDKVISSNDTIKFKAKFSFDEPDNSWVAFKLRSEDPYSQIWENKNTYFFLIRKNSISVGRVSDGNPVEYLIEQNSSILSDNEYHEIETGIMNQGEKSIPRLIFMVDGKTIIEYDDVTANNEHKFSHSLFSVNVFLGGKVEIETISDDSKVFGEKVSGELTDSEFHCLDSYNEKWAILQHVGAGDMQYYKTGFERNDNSIILNGPGSLVYKDMVDFDAINFDVEMIEHTESTVGSSTVLLYKSERDSYFGKNSLGVTFYSDGRIAPVAYVNNKEKKYPGINTGFDFTETVNVKIELLEKDGVVLLYIYAGSADTAYKYKIDSYTGFNESKRFLGILNNSMSTSIRISNIEYTGTTEGYSSSVKVLPVYLQDYISDENKNLLHWEYRADESSYYKAVITDADDNTVGEVFYPENTFYLPGQSIYDKLFIKAVNIDGTESEKVMVNLKENSDRYLEEYTERIKIRPDNTSGAEFYYSDSKKEFLINGFNYIKLRFGDHSTFEPASGILAADYDPYSAESMFRLLKSLNFNTVRVFVSNGRTYSNPGIAGDYNSASKISQEYMDNVTDFLRRAQKYGIYVIVCFGENAVPNNQYYKNKVPYSNPQDFLFNQKFMEAKLEYIKLFLGHIKSVDPSLLKAVLAVQEQNEFSFNPYVEPFSKTTGSYVFHGSGAAYDLSDEDSRRNLANDALKHYIKNVKKTIALIDPDILLTIGTSTLRLSGMSYPEDKGISPNKYNYVPLTGVEYLKTDIDFLDIHSYSFTDKDLTGKETMEADMESMLLNTKEALELRKRKPVVLGEYGSVKGIQDSFDSAKLFIIEQRNTAVENGCKGVLHWTFDAFSQNELFSAMEDNGIFLVQLSIFKPFDFVINKGVIHHINPFVFVLIFIILLFAAAVVIGIKKTKVMSSGSGSTTVQESASTYTDTSNKTNTAIKTAPFMCNFFGEFELYHMGRQLTDKVFLSVKARDLLIYMLNENREVSKDEIIEAIWGDKENINPDNLFHVTLYKLRKTLKALDPKLEYILCKNRLYSIAPSLFYCVHELFDNEFKELIDKENLGKEDLTRIQTNIDYYKNKYLYSYDYPWADVKREYYHGIYEKALLKMSRHYMNHSDYIHALKYLNLLIKNNPYYEEAYMLILSIYEKQGNKKAVKNTYNMYSDILSKDLGVPPSEEFKKLYENISKN